MTTILPSKLFIDGHWVDPLDDSVTGTIPKTKITSPTDRSVVGEVAMAGPEDVDRAVKSAMQAQTVLGTMPGTIRLKLLDNVARYIETNKATFAEALGKETGKSPKDAVHEVNATIERIRLVLLDAKSFFGTYIPAGWTNDTQGRSALVERVPIGVIGIISPFNYPLFIPAAKTIAALLAGNSVVLKPASDTPFSMLLFSQAVHSAGFPSGSFNVLTGSGRIVGNALVKHPNVDMIAFTGSTEVGLDITRNAGIKKLQLELGGKGVAMVLKDADLKLAAKKVVEGSLKNAGQRCDAVSVVYVEDEIADAFVTNVMEEMKPWMNDEAYQPLINNKAVGRVVDMVNDAVREGAKIVNFSGMVIYADTYMSPTLLDRVSPDSRVAKEETFGPVIPLVRTREKYMIDMHNGLPGGLDSSIFTQDYRRALQIARKLRTGSVTINDYPKHGTGLFPYGGTKSSGLGREGIGWTVEEMTRLKTIVISETE